MQKNFPDYCKTHNIEDMFVEVDAGMEKKKNASGLWIDGGNLNGCYIGRNRIILNASSSLGENSTVGVLNKIGFTVPKKIVEYADRVYDDESTLDARNGIYLARKLEGKELFQFAESRRENGEYLIESSLTDEDIERSKIKDKDKFKQEIAEKEKNLEEQVPEIIKSIYTMNVDGEERKICIVNQILNCGSWISYALGCDYYVSINENKENNGATMAILSNRNKGVKLPQSILNWARNLRENGKDDKFEIKTKENDYPLFIQDDKIIIGGFKSPDSWISLTEKSDKKTQEVLIESIKNIMECEKVCEGIEEMIESAISNYKNKVAIDLVRRSLYKVIGKSQNTQESNNVTATNNISARDVISNLSNDIRDNAITNVDIAIVESELEEKNKENRGEKLIDGH